MNKKLFATLLLSGMLLTTNASHAAGFWSNFLSFFKASGNAIVKESTTAAKTAAKSTAQAQITAYENQIAAKQRELEATKNSTSLTFTEKYKKVRAINSQIKELKQAIKELEN